VGLFRIRVLEESSSQRSFHRIYFPVNPTAAGDGVTDRKRLCRLGVNSDSSIDSIRDELIKMNLAVRGRRAIGLELGGGKDEDELRWMFRGGCMLTSVRIVPYGDRCPV
jgi:hypothetical protein